MEKNKLQVAIYSIHSDYKKLSVDFEKLKNLVTDCLQNDSLNSHVTDIFFFFFVIDYHFDIFFCFLFLQSFLLIIFTYC